jgi:hypothetical protein
MSGVKGLNTTDSVNRVRFANLSQRLSRVNVDVVHKTSAQGSLDLHHSATPSTGPLGCHFQDELEHCKTLDTASQFKRLATMHDNQNKISYGVSNKTSCFPLQITVN